MNWRNLYFKLLSMTIHTLHLSLQIIHFRIHNFWRHSSGKSTTYSFSQSLIHHSIQSPIPSFIHPITHFHPFVCFFSSGNEPSRSENRDRSNENREPRRWSDFPMRIFSVSSLETFQNKMEKHEWLSHRRICTYVCMWGLKKLPTSFGNCLSFFLLPKIIFDWSSRWLVHH